MVKSYYNLPKPLDIKDYEHVLEEVIESIALIPEISAVYLLGDHWQPGVSDMDLLVVCEENTNPYMPSPWSFSDNAKFIFTHRYLTMGKLSASEFLFLFPPETTRTKLVSGDKIDFKNPKVLLKPEEYKDFIACIFFDLLVTKIVPLISSIKIEKRVDVRSRIGAIYSLLYSERLLDLLFDYEIRPDLRKKIILLRNDWFNHDDDYNLDLMERVSMEVIPLITNMVKVFSKYCSSQYPMRGDVKFSNKRYTVSFVENWDPQAFLESCIKGRLRLYFHGRKIEHDDIVFPASLSVFLSIYSRGSGPFSDLVRKSTIKISGISEYISEGANTHLKALNKAFLDYASTNGFHKIPYTYGFSPRSSWWRNSIISILLIIFKR